MSLTLHGRHMFGGSIIAENLILTAAHAVHLPDNMKLHIRAGITNLDKSENSGTEQDLEAFYISIFKI